MKAISMTSQSIGSALLLMAVVPAFAHHPFAVFSEADSSVTTRPARDGSHYTRVRAVRRADYTLVGTLVNPAETVGEQQ
jgi:hypothetical protein